MIEWKTSNSNSSDYLAVGLILDPRVGSFSSFSPAPVMKPSSTFDRTDWQSRLDTADLKGLAWIETVLSFHRRKQTEVKISFCVAPHTFSLFRGILLLLATLQFRCDSFLF